MVHKYAKTMPLKEAIRKAALDCIAQNVLKDFLETHIGRIVNMLIGEYDWDLALEVREEEGWEAGIAKGREEGMAKGMAKRSLEIAKSLRADGIDVNTIAKWTGLTVDDILQL
jgi:hypothetical protein